MENINFEMDINELDNVSGGCWGINKSLEHQEQGRNDYYNGTRNMWHYLTCTCYRTAYNTARDLDKLLR